MPRYEDDDEYDDRPRRARERDDDRPRRESLIDRRQRVMRGDEDEDDDHGPVYNRYGGNSAQYTPRYPQPTGTGGTILYMLLGLLAVGLLLFMLAPRLIGNIVPDVNIPAQVEQIIATPTPTLIDRGATIRQIRNLNRLETQEFNAQQIIEAKSERGNPLDLLLADRLLLIAEGTVIAGVDMSKISDQDVTISPDGNSITLNLPPTEIFVRTLDNERTRVYDRQTGVFANQSKDLETQARQEAEQRILDAACEAGVMQKAADNAARSLEQFLALADFETITVNAQAGDCAVAQ